MIIGKIHPGSGLGDQLFTYITTRTIALDKGYEFGFVGKEFFKGKDFMQLDWGKETRLAFAVKQPEGKLLIYYPKDLRNRFGNITEELPEWEAPAYYDPEVNFIEDGTIVDATCAQDFKYWGLRLNEIRKWIKVEPIITIANLCVINFRGGEFATVPELFLPKEYWQKAIEKMKKRNQFDYDMDFVVHTDDSILAKQFFPDFKIIQDISLNWRSIRYSKYLILSNSAFGILPALLNENVKEVIAPRYWARRNIKQWSMPSNYYKKFTYI